MALDYEGVRAPQFVGAGWLNSARPLSLVDLRGRVVLLDFWTYGCINCQHVLDDLRYLERKYAGKAFAVIGVHSPKFAHEMGAEPVLQAVARLGISHPVLLDSERRTWDAYAVRAWPTLVLLDPRGYILGRVSGEGNRERLDAAIGRALDLAGSAGWVEDSPLPVQLEADAEAYARASPLLYPGKVLADAPSNRLAIADTGHHRIVLAALDGGQPTTIGSGEPGWRDGDARSAQFRSPQGLALDASDGILYIADTGNSLLRGVDLSTGAVTTLAGTGKVGFGAPYVGPAREVTLNSPWDVCWQRGRLYLAMAGTHSIWVYDPGIATVARVAGNGAEGRADGPPHQASFAQPSGLSSDGRRVYVADSESSCIRELTADDGGDVLSVRTIAGGDLFHFGLRDGVGDVARFQHPQGIAWAADDTHRRGMLYVADTYNSSIRTVDAATGEVATVPLHGTAAAAGGHHADHADHDDPDDIQDTEQLHLCEPGGLSLAAGALYIADTNAHLIRRLDLRTGVWVVVALPGLCAPGLCLPG